MGHTKAQGMLTSFSATSYGMSPLGASLRRRSAPSMPGDGDGVVKSPVAAVAGERLKLSDLDDTSPAAAIAAAEEAHRKQRDAEFASKRRALEAR